MFEDDVHALESKSVVNRLVASEWGWGGRRGLTLPLPPAHPMVCWTPATRLVGMVVK